MKKFQKNLRSCPLFKNLSDEDILKLLGCLGARVESFDKKSTIIAEETPARYIGIVLSGSAQIMRIDYFGNRSILSEVTPSEVFGEAFACAGIQSIPITVIANEPCEIMLIECSRILNQCEKSCACHQQLIINLIRDLAVQTIKFHQRIEITSKRSTRDKLLAYLMLQSKKAGSSSFTIPFDRQELADFLEVDRSGLSAEIGKLRREGILKSEKKHFELL